MQYTSQTFKFEDYLKNVFVNISGIKLLFLTIFQ